MKQEEERLRIEAEAAEAARFLQISTTALAKKQEQDRLATQALAKKQEKDSVATEALAIHQKDERLTDY